MDEIEYIDYDPCDAAGVYDNSYIEDEALELEKKYHRLLERARLSKMMITTVNPTRRATRLDPSELTSLIIPRKFANYKSIQSYESEEAEHAPYRERQPSCFDI